MRHIPTLWGPGILNVLPGKVITVLSILIDRSGWSSFSFWSAGLSENPNLATMWGEWRVWIVELFGVASWFFHSSYQRSCQWLCGETLGTQRMCEVESRAQSREGPSQVWPTFWHCDMVLPSTMIASRTVWSSLLVVVVLNKTKIPIMLYVGLHFVLGYIHNSPGVCVACRLDIPLALNYYC